jgi:hypothetical protein
MTLSLEHLFCPLSIGVFCNKHHGSGEVAEWLNALLSKSSGRVSVSRVRISPSPPFYHRIMQLDLPTLLPTVSKSSMITVGYAY